MLDKAQFFQCMYLQVHHSHLWRSLLILAVTYTMAIRYRDVHCPGLFAIYYMNKYLYCNHIRNWEVSYLIFFIFLHRQNFWRIKFTPEKTCKLRQNTQYIANFLRYYGKIHSKLPIFRVKSVKIYTGQKKFTWAPPVTNMRYGKCRLGSFLTKSKVMYILEFLGSRLLLVTFLGKTCF